MAQQEQCPCLLIRSLVELPNCGAARNQILCTELRFWQSLPSGGPAVLLSRCRIYPGSVDTIAVRSCAAHCHSPVVAMAYRVLRSLKLPSVALYRIEWSLKRGFESYLRSHYFQ